MTQDIEDHADTIFYQPVLSKVLYLRDPIAYFPKVLRLTNDSTDLIAADYAPGGPGYNGYLKNAVRKLYCLACDNVANTWNTLLTNPGEPVGTPPSKEALTWYLVAEIDYLLNVKHNPEEAENSYKYFARTNPGIVKAYEKVGDSYYDCGMEDRAVQEWRAALAINGPGRDRIVKKLAQYYISVGQKHLEAAQNPDAPERSLDDALAAFKEVMTIDRTNTEVIDLLKATQQAKKEKDDRRQAQESCLAKATSLSNEAKKLAAQGNYQEAINKLNQIATICDQVTNEFKKLHAQADDVRNEARVELSKVMENIITEAESAIDDGDKNLDEKMFDDARTKYASVEGILALIDDNSSYGETKKKLIDLAKQKLSNVDIEEKRYKEEQARLHSNRGPGAKTGAPGRK